MGGKNWRSAGRSVIGLWDTAQSALGKPADQIGYDKAPHLNEDKLFMEPENWEADKLEQVDSAALTSECSSKYLFGTLQIKLVTNNIYIIS